ncbi:MAG: choice-of-anchor L domain-containing protein, partial [Bacteroidota bacterium]
DNAEGPNNDGGKGGRFNLPSNDPDLRRLAGIDTIMDVAALEFDFTPLDSIVTFRYVFASEEYCEYVDNVFNDVFGFFVSGPGIRGEFSRNAINVALIPESQDFVTINSVNHLRNSNYFISNVLEKDATTCGLIPNNTDLREKIQYDGFTKILTAQLNLIPCETYHLKLVVADVGDDSWDSAVFLEAESFNLGGELELATRSTIQMDTIPEGCDYGSFVVSRIEGSPMNEDISIGIRVGQNSTAVEGIDFRMLPDSVLIPAGQNEVEVPLMPIIDNEIEPTPETIELEFDFPCACISGAAVLYLLDPPMISTGLGDQLVCLGDRIDLTTTVNGGVEGYRYLWSTGALAESISATIVSDSTFTLTVTDTCGRQFIDQVEVNVRPVPQAWIPDDVQETCLGGSIDVPITFTGDPPYSFSFAQDGALVRAFTDIYQNPFFFTVDQEGHVTLQDFSDANCSGSVRGSTDLRYSRIQSIASSTNASCDGSSDGSIDTETVGGTPPYQYNWGPGLPAEADPSNLPAGEYIATITDANGCEANVAALIRDPEPLEPISFQCRAFTADQLRISARGGTAPYLYSVDGGPFSSSSIFNLLEGGSAHVVSIQDAQGCQIQQDFLMPVLRERLFDLQSAVQLDLGETYVITPELNIPESLVESVEWTPIDNLSCSDCLTPEVIALEDKTYVLRVDDIFGCVDGGAITVKLNKQAEIFIPSSFSPDGDRKNDLLVVYANPNQIQEIEKFEVYHRWGTKIYERNNFPPNEEDLGWDGKLQGRNVDPGIYIYTATFILTNGVRLQQNGTVLLLR